MLKKTFLFSISSVIIIITLVVMYMKLMINGFGEMDVEFLESEELNDFYFCSFKYKRKKYTAVIDKKGNLLIPFSNVPIQECLFNFEKSDYCFIRYTNGKTNYQSYHFSKNKDNTFMLKAEITGNEFSACRIIESGKNSYWFIETTTNNITTLCLYDIKKAKIITPAFTQISFEEEKSRVLAYATKELYGEIDGELEYLTTIATFIDKDGNFLAPLYDMKNDMQYPALDFNHDPNFRHYHHIINLIIQSLGRKYIEERDHVDAVLADMYTNIYTKEQLKPKNNKAKIMKFPSEV